MKKLLYKILSFFKKKKRITEDQETLLKLIGTYVIEQYINSRKFRRSVKGTNLDEQCKRTIELWEQNIQKKKASE